MKNYTSYIRHHTSNIYTHACMPKAVARAVNNVMVIFRILPQIVLFSFSISFLFFFTTEYTESHGVFLYLVILSIAKDLVYIHLCAPEIFHYTSFRSK